MKRISVIGFVMLFVCAVFTTAAMADTFNITANFGVPVAEKGTCEQVGAMTLVGADPAVDTWDAGITITVELLAGALICTPVDGANYDFGGAPNAGVGDYEVNAVAGNDFFTITVNTASAAGDTIRVGHDEFSSMCYDLSDTPYNSTDPNLQLVQVSVRDSVGNTYSSDTNVATVKPQRHTITVCPKTDGGLVANGWPGSVDPKTGLIEIPLCDPEGEFQSQGADCGEVCPAFRQVCIKITDSGSQFSVDPYEFSIKTSKVGVGIQGVEFLSVDPTLAPYVPLPADLTRRDINGDPIASDTTDCTDYIDTKEFTFTAPVSGPGPQWIVVTLAYDSCTATPGLLTADIGFSRVPCGDSYERTGLPIANMVSCDGGPGATYEQIFPYATNFSDGAWWVGIALTNLHESESTINLDIYEADGDKWTATVTIPGLGISTNLAGDLNPTSAGDDAVFGDERFWIDAHSNLPFSGFLMQGDGQQANGYLPIPARQAF